MTITDEIHDALLRLGWTPPTDIKAEYDRAAASVTRWGARGCGCGNGDTAPLYIRVAHGGTAVMAVERHCYEAATAPDGGGIHELLGDHVEDTVRTSFMLLNPEDTQ